MQAGFDIEKLYSEAQNRWLKPSEVLFILQNYNSCTITPEPPNKPPGGSLFLFNRRVLRFFRNDGHAWRRKKDGRTVGEAHERLKVGNVDALNCYYAHGEQNPYFQRRSYWILDPAYEHIVLVHYREVAEGRYAPGSMSGIFSGSSITCNQSVGDANTKHLGTSDFSLFSRASAEEVSSKLVARRTDGSFNMAEDNGRCSRSHVNQALRMLELQLSLDDDDPYTPSEEKLPLYSEHETSQSTSNSNYKNGNVELDVYGIMPHGSEHSGDHYYITRGMSGCDNSNNSVLLQSGNNFIKQPQPSCSEYMTERSSSLTWSEVLQLTPTGSTGVSTQESPLQTVTLGSVPDSSAGMESIIQKGSPTKGSRPHSNNSCLFSLEMGDLSVNSYGSSSKQIPQRVNDAGNSDCITYQDHKSDLQTQLSAARRFLLGSDDLIESPTSDYSEMALNQSQFLAPVTDSNLSAVPKQLFSIREISPEWAFSSENTKVIITGDFFCSHSGYDWKVMFDDNEVPAEIIQQGVIRCQAPLHAAGLVRLCVTCGKREACSEVKEFEYREKPDLVKSILDSDHSQRSCPGKSIDELLLLVRFGQILLCRCDATSSQNDEKGELLNDPSGKLNATNDQWFQTIESLLNGNSNQSETMEWFLQELLKDKFKQWLSSKVHEVETRFCSLSKEEQSIIHIISGLGYDWSLNSILSTGIGVNFRDHNGWTALHWAAHFGREKMVAALLAAGASAGAVTDPTAQDPVGKTPASIAAASGHKGLAGYLSEVAITSHLTSLTMEESDISEVSVVRAAESTVGSDFEKSIELHEGATEDQLSLKDSLAAVRNATLAAARIQSAFRAHSFRKKRLGAAQNCDDFYLTPQEIHDLSATSKSIHGHRDQKCQSAALCIQRKYRGWRGRRNFLTLRQHVVKIQAHVRGHQVRKKYREFLWTVSVVEKVILRWRRKGVGLRGFKVESESIEEIDTDDILKVFRKQKVDAALDEAVSRVLSVVESSEARQQYRRMLERYRLAKAELESAQGGEAASSAQGVHSIMGTDDMIDLTLDEAWAHLNPATPDQWSI